MSYTERSLTSDFSRYIRNAPHVIPQSAVIEFKCIKKKSLNLKHDLRPHQFPNLFRTKYKFIYHKLSDLASFGGNLPFDAFYLTNTEAYLATLFYEPRKPKHLYFMPVNTLASLALNSDLITKDQFIRFSEFVVTL